MRKEKYRRCIIDHHHHHARLLEVVKRNRQHTVQKIDVGISILLASDRDRRFGYRFL